MKNVKEMKPKTLIVYEDNAPDLAAAAKCLLKAAEDFGAPAKMKSASAVTVDEVLAAKLIVFGGNAKNAPAYAELSRIFKGMNLAGRRAAFFLTPGSKAAEGLRDSLKDTDVSCSTPDLYIDSDSAALASWLRAAIDF